MKDIEVNFFKELLMGIFKKSPIAFIMTIAAVFLSGVQVWDE